MINGNETFSAPYAGSDALSSIDFSKAQITNTIGTGDFDQASLNSSGHQNVFAHAEDFADDQIKIFYEGIYTNDDEDDEREGQEIMSYSLVSKKDYQEYYEDTKWNPCKCDEQGCLSCFLEYYPHTPEIKNGVITSYGSLWFEDDSSAFNAETFAAASTARPDLPREKRNVLNSVRSNYDPSFSWSACSWGPYFNRFAAEGSNKFYSVWVWERAPGIYTAMGAYGGLGQNPRLFNVGQTRDLQQAVNMAKKKLQSKQKKGYQTYSAEYMENLSNAIVQFEDGAGFSSASAPPNDIFFSEGSLDYSWINYGKGKVYGEKEAIKMLKQQIKKDFPQKNIQSISVEQFDSGEWRGEVEFGSEEGNAPVQDPMELGEMANWTPLDGSEGLKRKRAESQVFALTYFLQNDFNMEDINDVTEALELYLSLSEDIAEMDASGLQKHPRYEVANRMLSDLSYRLDELQTQLPEIDVDIEMDAEYEAWRSAFTDGAAATQIHKYDRNWMQKVMNPRSRQIKSMWNDAKPSFNEELRSAESLSDFIDDKSFLDRISPLSWGLGMVAAFFLGKKL